jgi:uncharacterized RDD family membrane protein YckC
MTPADRVTIPHPARAFQGRPAGLVTRVAAALVDAALIAVAVAALYSGAIGIRFAISPTSFTLSGNPSWALIPLSIVVTIAYLTESWGSSGRTYGNALMGIRVVSRSGQRIKVPRALLRAALCTMFPIGLLWVAVSRSNRSLQDLLIGTKVIYDWLPHRPGL